MNKPIKLRPKSPEDRVRELRPQAGEALDYDLRNNVEDKDHEAFLKAIMDEAVERLLKLQGR